MPTTALPELVPRIPAPARSVLRTAVWTYGRLTAAARPLPDFLVIGAQRAGTTTLYAGLRRHPAIAGPSWKEVSFLDRHYGRGEAWYRGHFPNELRLRIAARRAGRRPLVGEASPSYLFHPHAPRRAAETVPDARFVALLRDPVERAFSHYRFEVALGREQLSFEEALEREDERIGAESARMAADPSSFGEAWWNYGYAARSRYAEQLTRWLAVFPPEQLLVLVAEELFADPARTLAQVHAFLGVEGRAVAPARLNAAPPAPLDGSTRARLRTAFAEDGQRLEELLGRPLPWN